MIGDTLDGIRIRPAVFDDVEAWARFNAVVHGEDGAPDEAVAIMCRDALSGRHPTVVPDDILIAEDVATAEIVSTLIVIPQTWAFDGIELPVGCIEVVGTHPDYRRRGIVRQLMELIHRRSDERHIIQVIAGIPYYYRQFGYEYALPLGGWKAFDPATMCTPDSADLTFLTRAATENDAAFLVRLQEGTAARNLVICQRDEAQWRWELSGRTPGGAERVAFTIVTTASGQPVGAAAFFEHLVDGSLTVEWAEIERGQDWTEVAPALLRSLRSIGERLVGADGAEFLTVRLQLERGHPLVTTMPQQPVASNEPYAWYVRVPSVVRFLQTIGPSLERRLAASEHAGFSGAIAFNTYRAGVQLTFLDGRVTAINEIDGAGWREADVSIPPLVITQLLLGYRSLDDLKAAYPDCLLPRKSIGPLIETLFPTRGSSAWMFV